MDPILLNILFGVAWFLLGYFTAGLLPFLGTVIGGGLAAADLDGPAVALVIGGWVLGVGWAFFVTVQVIIHIVTLFQQLAAL